MDKNTMNLLFGQAGSIFGNLAGALPGYHGKDAAAKAVEMNQGTIAQAYANIEEEEREKERKKKRLRTFGANTVGTVTGDVGGELAATLMDVDYTKQGSNMPLANFGKLKATPAPAAAPGASAAPAQETLAPGDSLEGLVSSEHVPEIPGPGQKTLAPGDSLEGLSGSKVASEIPGPTPLDAAASTPESRKKKLLDRVKQSLSAFSSY